MSENFGFIPQLIIEEAEVQYDLGVVMISDPFLRFRDLIAHSKALVHEFIEIA